MYGDSLTVNMTEWPDFNRNPNWASNSYIHETALVDSSVVIGNTSMIGANCVISEGARIGTGCRIHAGVIIGSNVTIENDVEIKGGSIIEDGSYIMDGARIGSGSIISEKSVVGAYVITCRGYNGGGRLLPFKMYSEGDDKGTDNFRDKNISKEVIDQIWERFRNLHE